MYCFAILTAAAPVEPEAIPERREFMPSQEHLMQKQAVVDEIKEKLEKASRQWLSTTWE